jgi:hypothetical protein
MFNFFALLNIWWPITVLFILCFMALRYIKTLAASQMHNSAICVFIVLLRSYMIRHCRQPRGADTKFSLKHRGIQNLQQTYIYFDVKLQYTHDLTVDSGGILCLKITSVLLFVMHVMLISVQTRSAFWMSCVCGSV